MPVVIQHPDVAVRMSHLKHKPLVPSCVTQHMLTAGYEFGCFFHTTCTWSDEHEHTLLTVTYKQMYMCSCCLTKMHIHNGNSIGDMLGRGMAQIQGPWGMMLKWLLTKTSSSQKLCQSCPSFLKLFQFQLIRMEFCFILQRLLQTPWEENNSLQIKEIILCLKLRIYLMSEL